MKKQVREVITVLLPKVCQVFRCPSCDGEWFGSFQTIGGDRIYVCHDQHCTHSGTYEQMFIEILYKLEK